MDELSISNIISLLGGVALFLFGMNLMGDGLKKVAGNKLELSYYESSQELSINLDAPMEFSDIAWLGGEAGGLLPVPKSLVGKIENESASGFTAYIANTPIGDFNAYVSACAEKGFDADYTKDDGSYSAKNADGWSLTVEYIGFNTMSIQISAPEEAQGAPAGEESDQHGYPYWHG